MGLFSCKACAAKDAAIAALEKQLIAADERERKAAETIAGLADITVHARVFPRQKEEREERSRSPRIPTAYDAMSDAPDLATILPPGFPKKQADLEKMFSTGMRTSNNMGVPEIVEKPSGNAS